MPLRKVNDVKQVEPGARPGDTAPDTGRGRDNGLEAAAARDIKALRREMERRDLPAGPPPTFEVSQLEIETDIQQVIARVEAARAQAREADALKIEAKTEERRAETEMARLAAADTRTGAPTTAQTGAQTSTPIGAQTGARTDMRIGAGHDPQLAGAATGVTGSARAPAQALDAQY